MEFNQELYSLFKRWLDRTEGLLIQQLEKQNIGVTRQLRNKLRSDIRSRGLGYLEGEISMLSRGRFIDMGVGRGNSLSGSVRGTTDLESGRKGRKPKKWYSKTFYGRLHDLYGAIGFEVKESIFSEIRNLTKY